MYGQHKASVQEQDAHQLRHQEVQSACCWLAQAMPSVFCLGPSPTSSVECNGSFTQMPALSPTMAAGKVVKWYKKEGDAIEAGDVLCDVETDKATVPFEMLDKGFIAKILLKGEE